MAKNDNLKDYLTDLYEGIATKKSNPSRNPQDFRQEIESIETGVDTSDATASASNILKGKTAYAKDVKLEGTIETYNLEMSEGGVSENRLNQLLTKTITEITASDLANVTSIGNYVIGSQTNLTSLTIPNSVTSIGRDNFTYTKLTSLTIPNSVTSIGLSCFKSSDILKELVINGNGISLGNGSFSYLNKLEKVIFIGNIASIGSSCFDYCGKCLMYDFSQCENIPTLDSYFNGKNAEVQFLVPNAKYEEWKSATNWSRYADYMVAV